MTTPASALGTTPQTPTNISHSANHAQPDPPPHSERGIIIHPGSAYSGTVNTQSSGSGRFSVVRDSRDSIHDQPLSLSTATHFQFGYLSDPSQSGDQLSRPLSPTNPPPSTLYQLHRSESTDLPSLAHGDTNLSPVSRPSTPFYTNESLGPRPMDGNRRRRSSNSMVLNIQNVSTEIVPISSSVYAPQVTAEPFDTDTPTAYSSPVSAAVDLYGEVPIQRIQPLNNVLPEGRSLQLINSDQVPRYTKNITISREVMAYDVEPLTTTFPYYDEPFRQECSPWIPATHPDGALYFYDPERRLFTDTDMHDPELRDEMKEFYTYLQNVLSTDQLTIPSTSYDLVLDIVFTDDKRVSWSYYYACHETRCLFWLEKYDASYMLSELYGVKSPAHIKHRVEALYWNHWSLFPTVFEGRRLPVDVYDELLGILVHGCIDMMTSTSSTLPYDDEKMRNMIGLVQKAKEANGSAAYYVAGTTRLLSFFSHWRFLYFHGQRHARLAQDQTVYDKPERGRSALITLLSPLLFLGPEGHLRDMERLWTDEVIIENVWKTFMAKLLGEWEGVILCSILMLTVNVGFLAIPGVILSNLNGGRLTSASQVNIFPSASQIAGFLSAEASIGSLVAGLLLVRHNRTKQREDPAGASAYLYQNCHRIFGLEPMAIVFSLPWALLMWSIAIFFIAVLLFCFTVSNNLTRSFVAGMSALVVVVIICCIRIAWEPSVDYDAWHKCLFTLRRTCDDLSQRVKGLVQDLSRCSSRHPPEDARSTPSMAGSQFNAPGV